jgi:site-specific recombinase XerD
MTWAWQRNYVTLRSGDRIRYALYPKPGSDAYFVRFKGKDGRYVRVSTGQRKKPDAIDEAHRLVREHYEEIAPTSATVTWEVAKEKLEEAMEADGKRPRTIGGYVETLNKLIAMFPLARGPADITAHMAGDFKAKYGGGTFTRKRTVKKGEKVAGLPRQTKSLDSRIRTLKAVFGWFLSLRLVNENPFEKITAPEMDRHGVKYVHEDDVSAFFEWLEERFPGWRMPYLFFSVKAATACRLDAICHLRSEQLRDGRLVFGADLTKNRSERYAILPADLYAELDEYKGQEHLWERYPAELRAEIARKGAPTHRLNLEFAPRRLYLWIVALMQDYQKATGRDLSSHDFRKAAFTRAAEKDIHPKRAAVAFDVTAETMLRYYTATEKKRTADEVLSELQIDLLPKKKPAAAREEEE